MSGTASHVVASTVSSVYTREPGLPELTAIDGNLPVKISLQLVQLAHENCVKSMNRVLDTGMN